MSTRTAPHRLRWRTVLLRALLGIALLGALTALALHWASRSDAVLRWAVAQVAQRLPGALTVTGMRGALARPVHVDLIEYVQDGTTVRARDVDLEWSPALLAVSRRLSIRSLHAAAVEITLEAGDDQPARLPATLELPLPIAVERLQVQRLVVVRAGTRVELAAIELAYEAGARFHTLQLARLDSQWGRLSGRLQLLAQPPFTLTGALDLRASSGQEWPVSAHLDLTGSLGEIAARGNVQVRALPPIAVDATAMPFEAVPLRAVTARIAGLDIAQVLPQAPRTALDILVQAQGTAAAGLSGTISAANGMSGPLDRARLPLRKLSASFDATRAALVLRDAALELGDAARASGTATLRREAIEARLSVTALDLSQLHSALRSTALDGSVGVVRTGTGEQIELDLAQERIRVAARAFHDRATLRLQELNARIAEGTLQATGELGLSTPRPFSAQASFAALDPAALGDFPAARLSGRAQVRGQLSPEWAAGVTYALERSRWRSQALSGTGRLTLSAGRARDVDARVALGSNRLALRGAIGNTDDRLQFSLRAPDLSALGRDFAGALDAEGTLGGTLGRPALDAKLDANALALPGGYRVEALRASGRLEPGDDPRIALQASTSAVRAGALTLARTALQVDGSRSAHRIAARASRGALDLNATLEGSLAAALDGWSGRVLTLESQGVEPMRLLAPAPLAVSRERVRFGPAQIGGANGRLHIGETTATGEAVSSSGSIHALRLARVLALLEVKSPVETDLVLGGRWQLNAQRQVDARVELFRESGDVTALIDDQRLALGVDRLGADIAVVADRVTAQVFATGRGIGLAGRIVTRLEQRGGRWGLPGTAPVTIDARAQMESIKPVAALFTRAAEVDGRVAVDVAGRGSVADIRLTGEVQGSALRIEQVGNGLYLTDGRLKAQFEERRIRLEELSMRGGDGRFTARGAYDLPRTALQLTWTAERLTAVQRPDLLLVASGKGSVATSAKRVDLRGALRMDRGRVELRETATRTLGDDVVVAGRRPAGPLPERVLGAEVDLTLDLGDDFRVTGRGVDARLVGQVRLRTPGNEPLRAQGEIKVARGTFEIYGRRLDIDPGALYFAGPVDNPALEIRAMRRNQAVEAGVEITGTARNPQVRLVSVPDVPDMEKLSWLTLGRRLDTASQSETEAMQRYGAALATTIGTGTFQSRIAQAVGLDEITVLPGTDAATDGGVVQLGKRVGDRIYLILEQRLSTAENIFKINYQLTRDWSVRLESGETDALDLFYTISFD
jgi:translocation and assembly module TamB